MSPVFSPFRCLKAVFAPPSTNEETIVNRAGGDDAGQGGREIKVEIKVEPDTVSFVQVRVWAR